MALIDDYFAGKTLEDLSLPEPKVKKNPKMTLAKIDQAVVLLRDVTGNGGVVRIAHAAGLSVQQVKRIQRKMNERIAELTAVQGEK